MDGRLQASFRLDGSAFLDGYLEADGSYDNSSGLPPIEPEVGVSIACLLYTSPSPRDSTSS
eukprot:11397433-Prorocentrum_lima.AAC.1